MDIKLKLFCTVAETKSFSKTSRIVHLSQPAVSLQIQALEEFFGTKLFDRTGGAVRLTPAGKILYKHSKHILDHYVEVEKDISKITGMIKGGVKLGASTTIGNYVFPRVIIEFKKNHPKIKIEMIVGNTKRIEDLLTSGLIDIGLVEGDSSKSSLNVEKLMSDELLVIVPPVHPIAKKKGLSILDIAREPLILREEGSGTRQKTDEYFESHGISISDIHVAAVLGSTELIKEAVADGLGISIVSAWAVKKELAEGKLKSATVREGKIHRDFTLLFPQKAHTTHAVDDFILFVKKYPFEAI